MHGAWVETIGIEGREVTAEGWRVAGASCAGVFDTMFAREAGEISEQAAGLNPRETVRGRDESRLMGPGWGRWRDEEAS
jgi:hypothetical protein